MKLSKILGYVGAFLIGILTFFKLSSKVKSGDDEDVTQKYVDDQILKKEQKLRELEDSKNKPVEDLSPEEVKKYWRE